MKDVFKYSLSWLLLQSVVVLTCLWGLWAGRQYFLPNTLSAEFPALQTFFFLPGLLSLHLLLMRLVSKKVSFWSMIYGLLIVPYLISFWPEKTVVFSLSLLPPAVFFSGKKNTINALLSALILIILYIIDPTYVLLPASIVVMGYGYVCTVRRKWRLLILPGVTIVVLFFLYTVYNPEFSEILSGIQPVLSLPREVHFKMAFFVYIILLGALWFNRLLSLKTKSILFLIGILAGSAYLLLSTTGLAQNITLAVAVIFQVIYAFWFQQMLFFNAAKTAHFLTWLLIIVHFGVIWYQAG